MATLQNLRVLSKIFSTSMFQNVVRKDNIELFKKQTSKYLKPASYKTNLEIIKTLYKALQQRIASFCLDLHKFDKSINAQ